MVRYVARQDSTRKLGVLSGKDQSNEQVHTTFLAHSFYGSEDTCLACLHSTNNYQKMGLSSSKTIKYVFYLSSSKVDSDFH